MNTSRQSLCDYNYSSHCIAKLCAGIVIASLQEWGYVPVPFSGEYFDDQVQIDSPIFILYQLPWSYSQVVLNIQSCYQCPSHFLLGTIGIPRAGQWDQSPCDSTITATVV